MKYVEDYSFLSFGRKSGKNLEKTWILHQKRIDAAKTASKRVVKKTAEATGDLIGKKNS